MAYSDSGFIILHSPDCVLFYRTDIGGLTFTVLYGSQCSYLRYANRI